MHTTLFSPASTNKNLSCVNLNCSPIVEICMSDEEIMKMPESPFKQMVKEKSISASMNYLNTKQSMAEKRYWNQIWINGVTGLS